MSIPQTNPGASYLAYKTQIDSAVLEVMNSGWYILGGAVSKFEEEFADYTGTSFCLGTANGTDSIELILRALGIGRGAKVATVPNTAVATVAAIERAGAEPRFVDISPEKFTMSISSLEELLAMEPDIKAIIPVHLFGCPADIMEICKIAEKHKIPVIEDCAQAHGASVNERKCGTFGIAGAFSFYPTKNLGALGDGGGIVTNNAELFEKMNSIRQYGWQERYISSYSGINSRLDEIQAAILSVKLKYLDKFNEKRRKIANFYTENLHDQEVKLPFQPTGYSHVFHQYVIRTDKRCKLAGYLKEKKIGTAIHYPKPIHIQPAYQRIPLSVSLQNTEIINDQILSLPMYPELAEDEMNTVVKEIRAFYS